MINDHNVLEKILYRYVLERKLESINRWSTYSFCYIFSYCNLITFKDVIKEIRLLFLLPRQSILQVEVVLLKLHGWEECLVSEFQHYQNKPTKIFCDDKYAIALIKNRVFHIVANILASNALHSWFGERSRKS